MVLITWMTLFLYYASAVIYLNVTTENMSSVSLDSLPTPLFENICWSMINRQKQFSSYEQKKEERKTFWWINEKMKAEWPRKILWNTQMRIGELNNNHFIIWKLDKKEFNITRHVTHLKISEKSYFNSKTFNLKFLKISWYYG